MIEWNSGVELALPLLFVRKLEMKSCTTGAMTCASGTIGSTNGSVVSSLPSIFVEISLSILVEWISMFKALSIFLVELSTICLRIGEISEKSNSNRFVELASEITVEFLSLFELLTGTLSMLELDETTELVSSMEIMLEVGELSGSIVSSNAGLLNNRRAAESGGVESNTGTKSFFR